MQPTSVGALWNAGGKLGSWIAAGAPQHCTTYMSINHFKSHEFTLYSH